MMDWEDLVAFSISSMEIVLRGTLIYCFLLAIFRFVLRRDIGIVGISDILFVVIVADASQSALSGNAKTVADGILLVSTPVLWNYLFDYISTKFLFIRRITEPPSIVLVENGKFQFRNMRREFITRNEVLAKMREQGIEEVNQIKQMRLEPDSNISVVKKE